MIKLYFFIFSLFLFSCKAQQSNSVKINSEINKEYLASRKSFVGKLSPEEYKEIRKLITDELQTQVPAGKSILINFDQYGVNCFGSKHNEKTAMAVIDRRVSISARISKENNAQDFFVYTTNVLNKHRYENRKNFLLDSGFFAKYIFSLNENCNAFFILKPNGEFIKYYGTDYYSQVEKFLKKK
ncbi:hypothetical protein OA84_10455 [Kaistella solincola]|uniref:TPM domain-containing protein n=1 Tax=Kaistella solincola TaxID=510955 RepID=A0ABR4ZP14_9FLAO|nr:hypothetical protein [Kaistella solincola]KIA82573.1 hypothetical protein OA84_10455 [Kaistella solincola]